MRALHCQGSFPFGLAILTSSLQTAFGDPTSTPTPTRSERARTLGLDQLIARRVPFNAIDEFTDSKGDHLCASHAL